MKSLYYYTTGEISKICGCAPRTVNKWIDSGILKGFRIPTSQYRRVHRTDLLRFLQATYPESTWRKVAPESTAIASRTTAEAVRNLKAFADGKSYDDVALPTDCRVIAASYETLELSIVSR